jgi:hypothetical protein
VLEKVLVTKAASIKHKASIGLNETGPVYLDKGSL